MENSSYSSYSNEDLIRLYQFYTTFPFLFNLSDTQKEKLESLKKTIINNSLNSIEESSEIFNNIFQSIIQNDKDSINKEYLTGNLNIIETIIIKYSTSLSENDKKNIKNITNLTIKIPKHFRMLNEIGFYIPNLLNLNLEGSTIKSIDEIGISFKNLKVLNVSNTGLVSLNGIICFINLSELYAAHNQISELLDVELCNNLEVLVINDNLIEEEDNFYFIMGLNKLKKLHIKNNGFNKYIANWKFDNVELDI